MRKITLVHNPVRRIVSNVVCICLSKIVQGLPSCTKLVKGILFQLDLPEGNLAAAKVSLEARFTRRRAGLLYIELPHESMSLFSHTPYHSWYKKSGKVDGLLDP